MFGKKKKEFAPSLSLDGQYDHILRITGQKGQAESVDTTLMSKAGMMGLG